MSLVQKYAGPVAVWGSDDPDRSPRILVTFDDGFESFITRALPVLEEMGIPAAVFVPFKYLGKKPSWIRSQDHPNADEKLMSTTQLGELPVELIEVGSHTMSHPRLSRLRYIDLESEIIESRTALERTIQRPVKFMSLPYGDYDERVIEVSRRCGYQHVFLNTPLSLNPHKDDYLQGRINVSLEDWPIEYFLKIMGAFQWLALAIPIKRHFKRMFNMRVQQQAGD